MARILSETQCQRIKVLNRKFNSFADKGWMCEGSDRNGIVCNAIFNNDTDEIFWADYNGNILDSVVKETSLDDMKSMAAIQAQIRKVCGD